MRAPRLRYVPRRFAPPHASRRAGAPPRAASRSRRLAGPALASTLASLAAGGTAVAGVVPVATVAELTAAIDAAQPGDEIVLADGTYRLAGATCDAVGTAAAPIVVRAANPLGAKIELTGVEGFIVLGAHWRFEGLDVQGACATDPACEHAFHVVGAAHDFVLRHSRVRDFNAQLKANATPIDGTYVAPDRGLIEYNELSDTRGRDTSNPVTKLNIDTGDDWVIRGNYLHDARKLQGNGVSYLAFLKSGGKRGLFERNLVICAKDVPAGGAQIGLSLGGGGTGAQFCAPAYDPAVPCSVEHDAGVLRNNIIANCNDVGIYLNRARATKVLHNTMIATNGVDFRFDTTSGEAIGNVLTSQIRIRDGAMMTKSNNQEGVSAATFATWYQAPLAGDLTVIGDVAGLIGATPARTDVPDDYCGAARPTGMIAIGALEHSLPGCTTTRPPVVEPTGPGGDAGVGGGDGGGDAGPGEAPGDGGGCCDAGPGRGPGGALALAAIVLGATRRRRRDR